MFRLGYDVGGKSVRACIFDDEALKIIAQASQPFPGGKGAQGLIDLMAKLGKEVCGNVGLEPGEVRSVGIGMPGTIDSHNGILLTASNLGLSDVPVVELLKPYFPQAEIVMVNDADAAALAEYSAGAIRGAGSGILITIGTGIGAGFVVDGKLFTGGMGVGFELGHIVLQHDGEMCTCGRRGCAEALCSASWLERKGRRAAMDYPTSRLALAAGNPDTVRARDVVDAARAGDGIAKLIFDDFLDHLTSLITTCCFLLNPEVIALGGGVSNAGDFLLDALRERVEKTVNVSYYRMKKIVIAELGDAAGMIGAAMLPAMEK